MPPSLPCRALAPVVLSLLASSAAAQYAEPSVHVLFQRTIGAARNLFGWAAAGLGDVNGDGVTDIAVSAPFFSTGFASSAGKVYVLSGADGSTLWAVNETSTSAILGYSLEVMDWNGDGVLDVVAGAPFAGAGRTWILSGVDGSTLLTLVGEAAGSGFGASLATGGDLDGDGTEDLVVAAPFLDTASGTGSGRVYAFTRGSGTAYTTRDGPWASAESGTGLAYVGDTNGDGRDELVIGYRESASFFDGHADVVEWNGASLALRFTVHGVGMGFSLFGDRVDGGGDADGDGRPDFLVGDTRNDEVEVFSGASGTLLHALDGEGELGGFGTGHFVPDMDGDGRADLAVGAWDNGTGANGGGKVFVYSGASGAVLKTITSTTVEQNLGIDVRDVGDFNGDGNRDLLVGAYGDGFTGSLPGAAIVFSGHLPAPPNSTCPAELATDPLLADAGGDPTAGPIIASPIEVFDLALDCSGAPAAGPYAMQVRLTKRATPLATGLGWLWIGGLRLYSCSGMHAQDVVRCAPSGVVLPNDPALVGLVYAAQGSCGGRTSNAIVQTIGG